MILLWYDLYNIVQSTFVIPEIHSCMRKYMVPNVAIQDGWICQLRAFYKLPRPGVVLRLVGQLLVKDAIVKSEFIIRRDL